MSARAATALALLGILGALALWIALAGPGGGSGHEDRAETGPRPLPSAAADRSTIEAPPDPECEAILERSLGAIEAGARATRSLTPLGSPAAPGSGGSGQIDPECSGSRAGARATPLTGLSPHEPVSLPLMSEDAGAAIVVRRVAGELTTTRVDASQLARSRYLSALYWFVAGEIGGQIVAVYSTLGYLPSRDAEAMTLRLRGVCRQRSGS